jgi:hypothetical protein
LIRDTLLLPDYKDYAAYNTERNIQVRIDINSTHWELRLQSLSELALRFTSAANALGNTNPNFDVSTYNNALFLLENGRDQMILAIVHSTTLYITVLYSLNHRNSPNI